MFDLRLTKNPELIADAQAGLSLIPKQISPKWFYDARGSALFEDITRLPEYYPTRTETGILRACVPDLSSLIDDDTVLMELGSGASVKTRILLDGFPCLKTYAPIDISTEFLEQTAARLSKAYPNLEVAPINADFMAPIPLPIELFTAPKLLFFPGSTIGNLDIDQAHSLLAQFRNLPNVRGFILGVDLVKDPDILVAAYNDSDGVTAAFNLNLLTRLNREAGANFNLDNFKHEARWNNELSRIEMHLVSLINQSVTIGDKTYVFVAGESLHTENSHKFTRNRLDKLATRAGWSMSKLWMDDDVLFAVTLLTPA